METRARLRRTIAADQPRHAINENAPSADSCRLFEQHAVCLLQLLSQHVAAREHNSQAAVFFQRAEIPAKAQGIPDDLVR